MRRPFFVSATVAVLAVGLLGAFAWHPAYLAYVLVLPIVFLGLIDAFQTQHAVRRNFPVAGHLRYLLEEIRPEISQYFIESDTNGRPFSRELRSIVYQRAKGVTDTLPFGTRADVYEPGYAWIAHSIQPAPVLEVPPRVAVGGQRCSQPYHASLLNVSAMSFGALSKNAILALNRGAALGGFAHNTGEGGISPYHLEHGGDLIWQIGTGYFGCRTLDGEFDPDRFQEKAALPAVKMIELKLSQGAKPGHGGFLPGVKVTPEIAAIRGVPVGRDVVSPAAHRAFDSPRGLLEFLDRLRTLSGGKPVGFKLCVGDEREFFAICKAIAETGLAPDFITVDGAEGGTGAAPLEFSNSVGMPLRDALKFVHAALVGIGYRDHVRIIASGRIVTGFDLAEKLALGADMANAARAMMFALGCIQALRCNRNTCPVGVATQDPRLTQGLVVPDKALRVFRYHQATVRSLLELTAAAGLRHPHELCAHHIRRRVSRNEVDILDQALPSLEPGAFLRGHVPAWWASAWDAARPETFASAAESLPGTRPPR
ncbi:MAG: FMN-binding glutamate synthase family protein [Dehalococcoidia bacterium]